MGNETDIPGGENQEIAFRGAPQDGRGEKGIAACGRDREQAQRSGCWVVVLQAEGSAGHDLS